jgi:aspartyl protease family protein
VQSALLRPVLMFSAIALGLFLVRDVLAPDAKTSNAEEMPAASDASPSSAADMAGVARLTMAGDGHYWASANVNGNPMRFLVDTGASLVVLSMEDANRAGVDLSRLSWTANVATASGDVKGARTRIDRISIGDVAVDNVEALVIRDGLEQSLLGMSFLNRLSGWEASGKGFVIRQ